jgi:uncharacterized protein
MKYLLDVNALIAFGVIQHQFHQRVADWIYSQRGSTFLTTSVTELGFVRVVGSVPAYGLDVAKAKSLLLRMKANEAQPLTFLQDGNDISLLPPWAKNPAQTTDGHLVQLAKSNGAVLATLDKGIPGAHLIP